MEILGHPKCEPIYFREERYDKCWGGHVAQPAEDEFLWLP